MTYIINDINYEVISRMFLELDVCHYYRLIRHDNRVYYVEQWIGDNQALTQIYFRYDSKEGRDVDLVIRFERKDVGEDTEYWVEVRQRFPRYRLTTRQLTPDEYDKAMKNIFNILEHEWLSAARGVTND